MTAFIPYVTFMKHAQKVTKGKAAKTRPILSVVNHRQDCVEVTDSHRAYVVAGVYEGAEKQVDPTTGLDVDHGNYPNIERLIDDKDDARYTHVINVNEAYEAVRAIELADRLSKDGYMRIAISGDSLAFEALEKAVFSVKYQPRVSTTTQEEEAVYLDIKYLKEAIHVLKDAKAESFTLGFHGPLRPIQIFAGNFTAIITPIRKGSD